MTIVYNIFVICIKQKHDILIICFLGIGILETLWDSSKRKEASAVAHGKNKGTEAAKNVNGNKTNCAFMLKGVFKGDFVNSCGMFLI